MNSGGATEFGVGPFQEDSIIHWENAMALSGWSLSKVKNASGSHSSPNVQVAKEAGMIRLEVPGRCARDSEPDLK